MRPTFVEFLATMARQSTRSKYFCGALVDGYRVPRHLHAEIDGRLTSARMDFDSDAMGFRLRATLRGKRRVLAFVPLTEELLKDRHALKSYLPNQLRRALRWKLGEIVIEAPLASKGVLDAVTAALRKMRRDVLAGKFP